MDTRTLADQLIADLGKTLTIPGLKLDEQTSSCVLAFDDELVLNIEFDEATARLVFSIHLGEIPPAGVEPLLRELLGANFFWQHTGGATLALEEATGCVILEYALGIAELDSQTLEIVIENLLTKTEEWRNKITKYTPEPVASSALPPATSAVTPIYG